MAASAVPLGCDGERGGYQLNLVFPDDEARTLTVRVSLWALDPTNLRCGDLVSGAEAPSGLESFAQGEISADSSDDLLAEVPRGEVAFFAAGFTAADGEILRGCRVVEVPADEAVEVFLPLEWVCRPAASSEIPGNGVDDDCDGLTDECEDCDAGVNDAARTDLDGVDAVGRDLTRSDTALVDAVGADGGPNDAAALDRTGADAGSPDGSTLPDAARADAAEADAWFELGSSAFGNYWDFTESGSASGGGVSSTAAASRSPAIAIDSFNHIYVAWSDTWAGMSAAGGSGIKVKRWNGIAWEGLGGSEGPGGLGQGTAPALAIDGSGQVILAYVYNDTIRVARWDGSSWQELDNSASIGIGDGSMPTLAVANDERVSVAWKNTEGDIHLKRWTGAVWEELGGSATDTGVDPGRGVNGLDVAVNADGDPTVVWHDYPADGSLSNIYLKHWDGSAWSALGESMDRGGLSAYVDSSLDSHSPQLELDASGHPIVAWLAGGTMSSRAQVLVLRWDGSAWYGHAGTENVPGVSGFMGETWGVFDFALALNSNSEPLLFWDSNYEGSTQIYAREWTQTTWAPVGDSVDNQGISSSPGLSLTPAATIDAIGNPVVAWLDDSSGVSEVYLKRFSGASWAQLGQAPEGTALAHATSASRNADIAIDNAGRVLLAWQDDADASTNIYFLRWSGTAWEELDGSASGGGVSDSPDLSAHPALAHDAGDMPVLAWEEKVGGVENVFLRRWNGVSWVELGGSASSGGVSAQDGRARAPDLAIDASGAPLVVWDNGTDRVLLRRWNGTNWGELGASASVGIQDYGSGFFVSGATIALDGSDLPAVAWSVQNTWVGEIGRYIQLRRWNSSNWEALGGSGDSVGGLSGAEAWEIHSVTPSLGIDNDGNPIVAWRDNRSGSSQIYLRRWNGFSWWEELGLGSATDGGLSNSPMLATAPAMAVDDSGRPWLTWQDAATGNYEISLRRWSGSSWHDVGRSSTGGGLSNSAANSMAPAIASRGTLTCVTWEEAGTGAPQIAVRCTEFP